MKFRKYGKVLCKRKKGTEMKKCVLARKQNSKATCGEHSGCHRRKEPGIEDWGPWPAVGSNKDCAREQCQCKQRSPESCSSQGWAVQDHSEAQATHPRDLQRLDLCCGCRCGPVQSTAGICGWVPSKEYMRS